MGAVLPVRVRVGTVTIHCTRLTSRYFLDLAWAQAGGLVGSAIQQELGVTSTFVRDIPTGIADDQDDRIGDLSVAFNVGLTVGAFTWGILVDVVGRKWCFNLTCLIASVFGFLFASEHESKAHLTSSSVKLRCCLLLLLHARIRSRWKHSYRRNDCYRVPAEEQKVLAGRS